MISPLRKACEQIWMTEMSDKIWKHIGSYQQGFRQGGSCHGQIHRLIGRMRSGKYVGAFFVDIKGAYNCVNRR